MALHEVRSGGRLGIPKQGEQENAGFSPLFCFQALVRKTRNRLRFFFAPSARHPMYGHPSSHEPYPPEPAWQARPRSNRPRSALLIPEMRA